MSDKFRLIEIEKTPSTNDEAAALATAAGDRAPFVVITDNQTAGRGQRGNKWESAPGKNLTFSLVLFPDWMSASRQFELSMLVSIGIVNALRKYVDEPEWLKIKWPNDIYFGDRKLVGILIENTVSSGSIARSIIGIGINVNQSVFESDAPNPISLVHVTGFELDRKKLLGSVVENILEMVDAYADDPEIDELTALYNRLLWRNDGREHVWQRPDGSRFKARIVNVEADGRLVLKPEDADPESFLFKEVAAVL